MRSHHVGCRAGGAGGVPCLHIVRTAEPDEFRFGTWANGGC
jgi:hypothetical protein